jgi:uncharacterized protein YneF (UPF0154 family)
VVEFGRVTFAGRGKELTMGWFIFLLLVVGAAVAYFWVKKYFRQEIERGKRINRANRE